MNVTITKVTSTDKKKDGSPLVGKFGPFVRVGIQCNEYGDRWINGFMKARPQWEGKTIELEITEEEWNGQKQLKFKVPPRPDQWRVTEDMWNEMRRKVDEIGRAVFSQEEEPPMPEPDF